MTAPMPGTIGYLASQYPYPSHTFIRREMAALRGAGLTIGPYSIRPGEAAGPSGDPHDDDVYAVQAQGVATIVAAQVAAVLRHPLRYFGALGLALTHRVPGLRAFIWALFHFAEAILLARRLERDGITRLHNHFANSAATVGLIAAHFLRIPWSVTLHGISEFDYPAGLLLADKLERADFAACVSYFGMAQAMRLTRPAIWPRLQLVRCAIDPADLPPRPARDAADDTLRLICVGRLSPEKGHAGLFAALARLIARGARVHLTLVGDGPDASALRALAGQLGLGPYLTFRGALGEAATLDAVARSDALVSASFMEGLPVVLMEAMALDVAVIAPRVAGIPELVTDRVSGLLFDPAHWAQLETAIEVMADPDTRAGLTAAARRAVGAEFAYPAAAQPLQALFAGSTPPHAHDDGLPRPV